jgi:hypothetical protein
LTIPGRKIESLNIGGGKCERLGEGASALAVPRDMNKRNRPVLRLFCEKARKIGSAEGVKAIRDRGKNKRAAFG